MTLLVPFVRGSAARLIHGAFVRRYKRFFVDVRLASGEVVVAHTANTGSMRGLLIEGAPVLLCEHVGTKRAFPLELEAIDVGGAWVGVNTGVANDFAAAAIAAELVPGLAGFRRVDREVSPSKRSKSRFDLLLGAHTAGAGDTFVEVKSVTLREGDRALFPDAVTDRGKKHLDALRRLVVRGTSAAMLYVVRRDDCARMAPARAIDPAYARALAQAHKAGVRLHAIVARVDVAGLSFGGELPVELS